MIEKNLNFGKAHSWNILREYKGNFYRKREHSISKNRGMHYGKRSRIEHFLYFPRNRNFTNQNKVNRGRLIQHGYSPATRKKKSQISLVSSTNIS